MVVLVRVQNHVITGLRSWQNFSAIYKLLIAIGSGFVRLNRFVFLIRRIILLLSLLLFIFVDKVVCQVTLSDHYMVWFLDHIVFNCWLLLIVYQIIISILLESCWSLKTLNIVIILILKLLIRYDVDWLWSLSLALPHLRSICCISFFNNHLSSIRNGSWNRWIDWCLAQNALYCYQLWPVHALCRSRFRLLCKRARVVLSLLLLLILFRRMAGLLRFLWILRVLWVSRYSWNSWLIWFKWISLHTLCRFDIFNKECSSPLLANCCVYLRTNTYHHVLIRVWWLGLPLLRTLRSCSGTLNLKLKLAISLSQSLGGTLSWKYPRQESLIILSVVLASPVDLRILVFGSLIILAIAGSVSNIDWMQVRRMPMLILLSKSFIRWLIGID